MRELTELTTTDRLKELLPQLFSGRRTQGDYYLRFQLSDRIFGLIDLKYVRESLTVPGDRITPIPNLPEYVLGLMSSRNQVFLAIDLAHLIGLPPETVNLRQYQTIIVRDRHDLNSDREDEANLFGLTVKRIEGIARILPQDFAEIAEDIPDVLRDFVTSAVRQTGNSFGSESLPNADRHSNTKASFLIDLPKLIAAKTTSDSHIS